MSTEIVSAFIVGMLVMGFVWFAVWLWRQPPPPGLPEDPDRKARPRDRG